MRNIADGVDGLADLLQDVVAIDLRQVQLGVADVDLGSCEQHRRVLLEDGSGGGQVIAQLWILQLLLALRCLLDQLVGVAAELAHVAHQLVLTRGVAQFVQIVFDDVQRLEQEMDVDHVGEDQQACDGRKKIPGGADHVAALERATWILAELARGCAHRRTSLADLLDRCQHLLRDVGILVGDLLAALDEVLRRLLNRCNESGRSLRLS